MAGINAFDVENIGKIMAARDDDPDWSYFTCRILRLLARSDESNVAKLAAVYPDEVAAYRQWLLGQNTAVAGVTRSNVRDLVHAARAAQQYVVDWHASGSAAKRTLDEALAPFSALP